MRELKELRQPNRKFFDNGVVQVFSGERHFLKNGKWEDINIDFKDNTTAKGLDQFLMDEHRVSVGFRKDGSLDKFVGLRQGEHQLEFSLKSINIDGSEVALPERLEVKKKFKMSLNIRFPMAFPFLAQ